MEYGVEQSGKKAAVENKFNSQNDDADGTWPLVATMTIKCHELL